jgi:argininosuccinate lyase
LFSDKFDGDALAVLQPEQSVERRKELAGTAKSSVVKQLRQAKAEMKRTVMWLQKFPTISPDLKQICP